MIRPSVTQVLERQSRHRRTARLWPPIWGAVAVLSAAPLAVMLTPLAFLVVALAVRALSQMGFPGAEAVLEVLRGRPAGFAASPPFGAAAVLELAILVLPGLAVGLAIWLRVSALFEVAGTEGVSTLLGAREPRPSDPAERRLVELAEEAADGASTAAPGVRILERADANVAVAGASPGDAVLLVTRGALDRLAATQLRALVFQRVAAIAAGDPILTTAALAVPQTIGLLAAAGDALFAGSPAAWRRLAVLAQPWGDREMGVRTVAALLADDPMAWSGGGLFPIAGSEPTAWRRALDRRPWLWALLVPLAPLFLVWVLYRGFLHLVRGLLIDPLMVVVLRDRCHGVDRFATELLDEDAGVASVLDHLRGEVEAPPGDGRLDALFALASERGGGSGIWSGRGGELSPHPPVDRRVARLQGRRPPALPGFDGSSPLVALMVFNLALSGILALAVVLSYLYAAVCVTTAWIAAFGVALVERLVL